MCWRRSRSRARWRYRRRRMPVWAEVGATVEAEGSTAEGAAFTAAEASTAGVEAFTRQWVAFAAEWEAGAFAAGRLELLAPGRWVEASGVRSWAEASAAPVCIVDLSGSAVSRSGQGLRRALIGL